MRSESGRGGFFRADPDGKREACHDYGSREGGVDVFDAVRTVLAVRGFEKTPVPDTVVDKILEAGRLTASAMNKQPWHFIVVKDDARLAELAGYIRSGPYVATAPLAVAVAVEKGPLALSDGSRAIQDMILTAWSEGVGSNWVGFQGMLGEVKRLLKFPVIWSFWR